MHSSIKTSLVALALAHAFKLTSACEGACISDTTNAFIGNYSMYHINPVFNAVSDMIHSKILPDRPIHEVRQLIAPINSHWHNTIYDQTEKAIFPGYFHGKCQRVIDGVLKDPEGCPNPDCPVVCGTPGSMVHFYDKLVTIVFDTMQSALRKALPTSGPTYDRLEQAVMTLATSSSRRRSSLYARSSLQKSDTSSTTPLEILDDSSASRASSGGRPKAVSTIPKVLDSKNPSFPLDPKPVLDALSERSSLPLDKSSLLVNPTEYLGSGGLPSVPSVGRLPKVPLGLLGRDLPSLPLDASSLPVSPTEVLGNGGLSSVPGADILSAVPLGLLGRGIPSLPLDTSSLPVKPTELLGSGLTSLPGEDALPKVPLGLLGRGLPSLPLDTSSLPVKPTELLGSGLTSLPGADALPKVPLGLFGRGLPSLPLDASSLPVNPTELLGSGLTSLPGADALPKVPLGLLGRGLPSLPLDTSSLPVNPTELLGSGLTSLPGADALPKVPLGLLGRSSPSLPLDTSSLPVNPAEILGYGGLPAGGALSGVPLGLLGRSTRTERSNLPLDTFSLPANPSQLLGSDALSSLPGTSKLPTNPLSLLSRSALPIDGTTLPALPTDLLGPSLLPMQKDEAATGRKSSANPLSGIPSIQGLPVVPTRALRRRSLPTFPPELPSLGDLPVSPSSLPLADKLPVLPVDPAIDSDPKELLSKLDDAKHQDLTKLPSSALVNEAEQRTSKLSIGKEAQDDAFKRLLSARSTADERLFRFKRVVRSAAVEDEEKQEEDSPGEEDDSTTEEADSSPSSIAAEDEDPDEPNNMSNDETDEPAINSADGNTTSSAPPQHLNRRQPGIDLPVSPILAWFSGSVGPSISLPLLSKRRMSKLSEQEITRLLTEIIESANRKFTAGCGAKLKNCRWDRTMKAFILTFP